MTIKRSEAERAAWLSEHEPARLRFMAEHERRAENRKHAGEPGRCAACGEKVTAPWTRCRPCRLKKYEDDARGGPPLGEHWPSPPSKPAPDLIDETPTPEAPAAPWEG